jgi:hypothetical protein
LHPYLVYVDEVEVAVTDAVGVAGVLRHGADEELLAVG